MQKQILIERIFRNKDDKDGNPYINKFNGKPQTKVNVQSEGNTYSAWDSNGWTNQWTEGQTIDVDVEESQSNGRTYLNIRQKKQYFTDPEILARLDKIEAKLGIDTEVVVPKKVVADNEFPF